MSIRLSSIGPGKTLADIATGVSDRLDSWKEIAGYLRREVRTVQLWEKNEGMPVHRHFHKRLGSVYAFRSEIDSWRQQVSRRNGEPAGETLAPQTAANHESHVLVHVAPLQLTGTGEEHRLLGQRLVATTIAALQQLDAHRLSVLQDASAMRKIVPRPAAIGASSASIQEYVLQWSVQNEGPAVRVDVSLLSATGESTAWSLTHRSSPEDFPEMLDCVSRQIVECLWLRLLCLPTPGHVPRRDGQRGAREAYLKGRYFWNQRNEEGLRKAVRCFESAIREDPAFALPYSGLADSLTLLSFYEIVSPSEAMPSARRAALKAIELGPDLAEAHASLADVLLHFDRDWQGADREYRRSLQCNPDYALGYHWYSNLLAARGQHEAAHLAIMHALEIDPVSIITQVWAGVMSHLAHRFDEAIRHYRSALELDPHFVWAHMYMAQALEQTGDFKQALREFEKTNQLAGGSSCVRAMQAHAYAAAGNQSSARRILRELKSGSDRQRTPSYDIAAVHAALGESRQVMTWLRRACQERNMKLFTLTQDPRFDPLRHRSEFKDLIAQMGLSESIPPTTPPQPS
jgi:tetratricopeptide (TPR) repeat protein